MLSLILSAKKGCQSNLKCGQFLKYILTYIWRVPIKFYIEQVTCNFPSLKIPIARWRWFFKNNFPCWFCYTRLNNIVVSWQQNLTYIKREKKIIINKAKRWEEKRHFCRLLFLSLFFCFFFWFYFEWFEKQRKTWSKVKFYVSFCCMVWET